MLAETEGHERPRMASRHGHQRADPAAKRGRRKADFPAKERAEAAERSESDVKTDFRHRPSGDGEQVLGAFEPEPREEGVRGLAKGPAEGAEKMPCGQVS